MSDIRGTDRKPIDFVVQTEDPVYEVDTAMGKVTIAPYQPGDEAAILECWNLVFHWDHRGLEQWNWAFRDNPNGIHAWLGKLDDGRVVSQFCGLPVRAKVGDETFTFAQIVDSMVHPECRSGLKKRGVFGRTLLAFAYALGGRDQELVQFGLPNPPAYRLGVQTLYYVPLMKSYVHAKRVEPEEGLPELPPSIRALREVYSAHRVETFDAEHEALFARVRARHDVICERDAVYLDWRYRANPNWKYESYAVRTPDGHLVGLAVTRRDWLGQPQLAIAEWLVDDASPGAAPALLKLCEHVARRDGQEKVIAYFNPVADEARVFEDADYDLEATQFRLVAHSYDPATVTEGHLNRHWYYTLGDFDVV
ncbi:MAG: GNAT family N-acetyltransferase [Planctomycetota bacterium]